MKETHQKLVIVGAGLAGLTAAAYLSREGYAVQLIEKNEKCGGMLNSFTRDGYLFDAGARSIENSGIIRPMLKDLGIDLPLLNSPVSIGVGSEVLSITDEQDISRYMDLLKDLYPEDRTEIDSLYRVIRKIVKSMHTIYGFDNPVFTKDFTHDYPYLFKQLLPWFGKFILAVMHMNRMDEPIEGSCERSRTTSPWYRSSISTSSRALRPSSPWATSMSIWIISTRKAGRACSPQAWPT